MICVECGKHFPDEEIGITGRCGACFAKSVEEHEKLMEDIQKRGQGQRGKKTGKTEKLALNVWVGGEKCQPGRLYEVPIDRIFTNPNNPRKSVDYESLQELAKSIREVGILQPLVLVPDGKNSHFLRIVAGWRRFRAAQIAGLSHVPAVIRELTPLQEAEIALIENLQRKNLNPIEEAEAYRALLLQHGFTQESLAEKLGVSQPHIANRLRLLDLPEPVRENISRGILTASHGKALAAFKHLPAPVLEEAAQVFVEDNIPVSKVEESVKVLVGRRGLPLFQACYLADSPQFDTGSCEGCKNLAPGKAGTWSDEQPYCLDHACWKRKQAKAEKERLEQARRALQDQGVEVIDLSKLQPWTQYRHWYDGDPTYDQAECENCEKRKLGIGKDGIEPEVVCTDPGCMQRKMDAWRKEQQKKERENFQAEVEEIGELARQACAASMRDGSAVLDKTALIYLATEILLNIDTDYSRKLNRDQYLKKKFGWKEKIESWYNHWDAWKLLRPRLESLTEEQLLEVIFEWPAVAKGLQGGVREWFLKPGEDSEKAGA